jgi:hypothetical protein
MAGKTWTADDLGLLRTCWVELYGLGHTNKVIVGRLAARLQRTPASVRSQAHALGLPSRPTAPGRGRKIPWKPRYQRGAAT